ncbi:putative zinc finger protein [Perkinsus sp. BL_2016]|nr:putative zinc finger protein [Perkinsus sp. BL_2016]
MCKYFIDNSCRKGIHCAHAHSESELQQKPVLSKTRMCKQILRSGNCTDSACAFAHEIEELTAANAFFRTKMCEFHGSTTGCKLGDKCRYAHTEIELHEGSIRGSPASLSSVSVMNPKSIPPVDFNDSPDTGYALKKRGSMGSRSTMASSYPNMANFAGAMPLAAPVVFVYPSAAVAYPHYFVAPAQMPYED